MRHYAFAGFQKLTHGVHHPVSLLLTEHRVFHDSLGVFGARGRQAVDFFIHHRLRDARVVSLVVTVTPVTHQIDHHVFFEQHAVFQRQPGYRHHRFRVIAVDMKNRRIHHFGDIAAIHGRARIALQAGGKPDLVVDNNVYGAVGGITARLRHLQGFHHHALPGKSRIAVYLHRNHFVAFAVAAAILTRAHRAFDHRADDFQMRGVERQRQMHRPAGGVHVGSKTLVVFDIAGQRFHILRAFELTEQLRRFFAEYVDQHIQPPAVRHADDHFLDAAFTGAHYQLIQQWNQGLAAFQRKAFLANIFSVQKFFQPFGDGQLLQDVDFFQLAERVLATRGFQLMLQPAFFFGFDDVHVFHAHRTAIGGLQNGVDIAQLEHVDAGQ